MEFKEAIKVIYDKYPHSVFNNPFLTFSIVSDFIQNDIYARKLAAAYFAVDKRIPLYKTFKSNSLADGRRIVSKDYKEHEYEHSGKEIAEAVNALSCLMHPKEFAEYEAQKKAKNPAKAQAIIVKVNKENKNNKPKPVIVEPPKPIAPASKSKQTNSQKPLYRIDIWGGGCNRIYILTSNIPSPILYKTDGKSGPRVFMNPQVDDGRLSLPLTGNKIESLYLVLPDQKYKYLDINTHKAEVSICGSTMKDPLNVTTLVANFRQGKALINVNCNCFKLGANYADVSLKGTYGYIEGNLTSCSLVGNIATSKRAKNPMFNINAFNGNVSLCIKDFKSKVGFGKLHSTRRYKEVQKINDKDVQFDIKTSIGKIQIYSPENQNRQQTR